MTPLNVLGKQNEKLLRTANIPAISITSEMATKENFDVSHRVNLYMEL